MNNVEAFKEAKYGLMLHFGLYSLLGGYYKGNKGPNYAEWIQCQQKISVNEMRKLATIFNPIYFDANEICSFAKNCGMKYIVITADRGKERLLNFQKNIIKIHNFIIDNYAHE